MLPWRIDTAVGYSKLGTSAACELCPAQADPSSAAAHLAQVKQWWEVGGRDSRMLRILRVLETDP